MRFQLTLHAPTHYLTSEDDTEPKPCDEMTCTLVCMPGYPITPMKAGYAPDRHLASPNVGRSGWACIDESKVKTAGVTPSSRARSTVLLKSAPWPRCTPSKKPRAMTV